MAIRGRKKVLVLIFNAFLVHTILLKATFDIYFSSPIDNGMTPIKSTANPPAKRVVFIVADGLRAEAIIGDDKFTVAPNLHKIIETVGSWGVSHTRVPTESRPGHVALLAGIYEDPSAILKGWKYNPVDFDSVINQSTHAWCWGGPGILNLFRHDNARHIHSFSYDPSMEDYGKNDTIGLDKWVFVRVYKFLQSAKYCSECRVGGTLFFLHLLGTDTAGHAFKPGSKQYTKNIKYIDYYIPKLIHSFTAAFDDNRTSYIFTSDHGMTDWGSHGAGSSHETDVPIVAWGAGIKNDRTRKDIEQIDVAPLISALMGINYPINSLGRLPVSYLDVNDKDKAEMLMTNIEQLMEIFNVKRLRILNTTLKFVPYAGIEYEEIKKTYNSLKSLSKSDVEPEHFEAEAKKFMKFLINGTDYYHNYYQLPLLIAITIGLIFWIIYLATYNVNLTATFSVRGLDNVNNINLWFFIPLYINMFILLFMQQMPLMFYIYFLFPVIMGQIVVRRYQYILSSLRLINKFGTKEALGYMIVYVFGLRVLVQGFKDRQAISFVLAVMALFPLWSRKLNKTSTTLQKYLWVCCCIIMVVFLFFPVVGAKFNMSKFCFGYLLWWIVYGEVIIPNLDDYASSFYIYSQHIIFRITFVYVVAVEGGLIESGSPVKFYGFLWSLVPLLTIPSSSTNIFARILSIFIAFETYYLMVTFNYENIFLFFYSLFLLLWLKLESQSCGYPSMIQKSFTRCVREDRQTCSGDYRRAFSFIVFIFLGFFGTGNIASLSSFNPMWVRCFLTVFSPFRMSALILVKIAIPFIFASCIFRGINLFRGANTLNMFCIVLVFADLMLLELLYYIKNIGSWLEIGLSLSQFIIMEAFVIILLLLYGFSNFITRVRYPERYTIPLETIN